jgi:hypothetical protein
MKQILRLIRTFLLIFIFSTSCYYAGADSPKPTDTANSQLKSSVIRTPQKMYSSCVRCHTIGKGKLIGPDLLGMNERHSRNWLTNFIRSSDSMIKSGDTAATKIYLAYGKLPMPNHNFSSEETKRLIDYIAAEGDKARVNPGFLDNTFSLKPKSNNWLIIIAIYIILFSIFDLVFTKFIKFKIVHVLLLLAGISLIGKITAEESILLGRSMGYEPDQPIKFSHRQHAGQYKINCVYCHTGVYESRYAGIPPAGLCLNCHNVIRKGTNTGEKEIDKIHQAIETGKPIKWVKVYNLPDFVFFSHAQHYNVGRVECKVCHGDVAKFGRQMQYTDLSMGWCINCHRQTNINYDNKYYANYKFNHDSKSKVTVEDIGGNNCSKCHY